MHNRIQPYLKYSPIFYVFLHLFIDFWGNLYNVINIMEEAWNNMKNFAFPF